MLYFVCTPNWWLGQNWKIVSKKKCFCPPKIDTIILEIGKQIDQAKTKREAADWFAEHMTSEHKRCCAYLLYTVKNKISHHRTHCTHHTYISKNNQTCKHALYAWAHNMQYMQTQFSSSSVWNTISEASWPASQQTPTSLDSVSSCSFPHNKKRGGKKERGSGLSEASHYYGNIAHTAQHCTDAGCHGYSVVTLAKELLHKQQ